MKTFPSNLSPENKERFPQYNYERVKAYLRRDIYEHILSHSENDYFELTAFSNQRLKDIQLIKKMTRELIEELTKIGWSCKLSFGESGLFIYSTENPPPSCWSEDESLE